MLLKGIQGGSTIAGYNSRSWDTISGLEVPEAATEMTWTGFLPVVSATAIKRISHQACTWKFPRETSVGLTELALRHSATG